MELINLLLFLALLALISLILNTDRKVRLMARGLDRVVTEVSELKTAVSGALARIQELSQQVRDNANDETRLNQIADELDEVSKSLEAASGPTGPEEDDEEDDGEETGPTGSAL